MKVSLGAKPRTPIPKLTDEEMHAIVDVAHRLGLKVSVHAMSGTIEQAVRAGADSIEHGWEMPASTDKSIQKQQYLYFCHPHLSAGIL